MGWVRKGKYDPKRAGVTEAYKNWHNSDYRNWYPISSNDEKKAYRA